MIEVRHDLSTAGMDLLVADGVTSICSRGLLRSLALMANPYPFWKQCRVAFGCDN
ncbi:MAG: hypothetical protein ACFCD0_15840 [Gemmataceae bacterium]